MNEAFQAQEIAALPPRPAPNAPQILSSETKSLTAFRTISEVAEGLALPQHVLRFWESKFEQIKPLKRGGGRRYYRPDDVKVLHEIKELLYNQGFTIRGVQKLLRDKGAASVARSMVAPPQLPISIPAAQPTAQIVKSSQPQGLSPDKRREIEGLLAELKSIRKVLQQTGI
ncbi:MAG: MerR family transcriptional regulator [Alphaproteobacteria bacterium]|nr:MerR family transcriptional regulator [Alphaproteobacteria bacterium]